MGRLKRIAKVSNRDRALYAVIHSKSKPFERAKFHIHARAHSARAGEELGGKRADDNLKAELDTLLADGLLTWDEDKGECKIPENVADTIARNPPSCDEELSPRAAYQAEAQHWRKIFPPTKRKTRLNYMWEYIRSRGRIWVLGRQLEEMQGEKERLQNIIGDLERRLATKQQSERAVAPATPGPSTPAAQAADAYPTPRSDADAEESPLLPSTSLPPAPLMKAPLTPVSNPRFIIKRRAVPPTPSPLARHVPTYADADDPMDDSIADNSMIIDQLDGLEGADDSMVLDNASETEDEKYDELSDIDIDVLAPLDEGAAVSSSKPSTGVFMRLTDTLGNFVGDLFTPGRGRSVGPSSTPKKSYELPLQPTRESSADAAETHATVGVSAEPLMQSASVMAVPSYCSRAVSPFSIGPDPRELEIAELKAEVVQLQADLEAARRTVTQKDAHVEDLQMQLENKQRRIRLLMNLHAQMDEEFEKERTGQ
ncbi:uncharacterized protein C8Q71DRAFT_744233 [Rhodofomes roseus]|uniref:Uncharacterized protein n=1 Tax=Rhodofomes roseus TaxID=34475 RepID=A0ABQ8KN99_9APHY|nr:uncharacterized protein C8Q71DRAFT_744233 [Rhodofomes roseus]KAH9839801.1 hypothetical protein C8Q71DRAFT_744233 [Rhodofomes roseus]